MITSPANMTLQDWADQVCLDVENLGFVGRLDDDDWQRWGTQLANNTSVDLVPNPYLFDDWRRWGFRLCEGTIT
jgi:hypothetical protein